MPEYRKVLAVFVVLAAVMAAGRMPALAGAKADSRRLSAVKLQIVTLRKQEYKSKTVINFWRNKGRWALHRQHDECWQLTSPRRERICRLARQSLAAHLERRAKLMAKLQRLSKPRFNLGNVSHWLCIHRGEGAWNSNTGNGYYGGLQMDWSFMSAYGPKVLGYASAAAMFAARGTANRWTPQEQMAVAEYARSSGRGYYPWPNTARACGLI